MSPLNNIRRTNMGDGGRIRPLKIIVILKILLTRFLFVQSHMEAVIVSVEI